MSTSKVVKRLEYGRGSLARRREDCKDLHRKWIDAGCPDNFVLEYRKNHGARRKMTPKDRQERLRDLADPGRVRVRKAQGELRLKRQEFLQAR